MKKIMVLAVAVAMAFGAFARPHGGFGHRRGGFRSGPMHHGGYRHHGSWWGRGGRNFWPGFVGGMVGGYCYGGTTVVTPAVVTTPTVVQPVATVPVGAAAPITVPVSSQPSVEAYQNIWVPGALVPVTNPDGSISYVRQPGHYERVRVQ